jgi:hypothetical protein
MIFGGYQNASISYDSDKIGTMVKNAYSDSAEFP